MHRLQTALLRFCWLAAQPPDDHDASDAGARAVTLDWGAPLGADGKDGPLDGEGARRNECDPGQRDGLGGQGIVVVLIARSAWINPAQHKMGVQTGRGARHNASLREVGPPSAVRNERSDWDDFA